uniref:Uncharacterized protein n=1 Tax=Solanum lycopersicum TaxID=4081 RepID=A0A3Q7HAJ2_SOLLC
MGEQDSNVKNAKNVFGRPSRPCLCIRLSLMANPTHFQGQTSPKAHTPILMIFVSYSKTIIWVIYILTSKMPKFFVEVRQDLGYASANHFLRDPDSDIKNAKIFCGLPLRPCLYSRLSLTASPTHFQGNYFLGDSDSDVKNAKNFVDVLQHLGNAFGWTSRPVRSIFKDLDYEDGFLSQAVRPIFKVKGAPKRAYLPIRRFSCAIANHFKASPTHFQGQTSPEASISPIYTIFMCYSKPFLGDPDYDVKNSKFFLLTKPFLGDLDSDIQNAKYFCGGPSRPYLHILLDLMASRTHFSSQIPMSKMQKKFVDILKDIVYVSGCPSRKVRPIFKTLAMLLVGPHGLYDPFSMSTSPEVRIPPFRLFSCAIANYFFGCSGFRLKNAKCFCGRPSRASLCIWLAHTDSLTHFKANYFLGDQDSYVKNAKKFFVDIRQDLCYAAGLLSVPVLPNFKVKRAPKPNHFLGDPDSNVKNAKKFCVRSLRPWLCSRLTLTGSTQIIFWVIRTAILKLQKTLIDVCQDLGYAVSWPSRPVRSIFNVKRGPKRIPPFRLFSCAIANLFLGAPDVDIKNAKCFCGRPSRAWICIWLALRASLTHFNGQTSPKANTFRRFSCAIENLFFANHFLSKPNSDVKNTKIFGDICQDLIYVVDWTSRPVRPIFIVKRAPKRAYPHLENVHNHFSGDPDSDIKKWKNLCGRPSKPWLCIRLALTASSTYFQGKRTPKRAYPSFRRFLCSIANHFLGDPDSDLKNAKIFCGHGSRPWLCSRLDLTATNHFLGDPNSDVKNAKNFCGRSSRPPNHFLGDPNSDVKNAKKILDVRKDLGYAASYLSRPVLPIFKVKKSPKRAYPQFKRFSCAIANHYLGDPDSDVKNSKKICRRLWLAITDIPTHFQGQMSPEARIPPHLDNFYLGNAAGFPSWEVRPIFNVKRDPKHADPPLRRFLCAIANNFSVYPDSDVKSSKRFCGCPSRPWIYNRFALTTSPTHFQANHFLGDPDFRRQKFQIFVDVCQYIGYAASWISLPVKRAPKRAYPPYRRVSCAITYHFLGDPDSDVKNAKFFCGRPLRPCICIRLAMTVFQTHLEGQTSPEASIPLISTVKRAPKRAYPSF